MKRSGKAKSFFDMTDHERTRDVAQYDREFVADKFRALTPAERARWQRAKRKPGRPVEGRGAQVISVSVERGLLAVADKLARHKRISRARLIARGLRAVLAAEGIAVSPPARHEG